jgi:hypothetical protein
MRLVTAALNGDVDPQWARESTVTMASGEYELATVDATLLTPEETQLKDRVKLGVRFGKRGAGLQRSRERSTTSTRLSETFRPSRTGELVVSSTRLRFLSASRDLPPIEAADVHARPVYGERVIAVHHGGTDSPARFEVTFGGVGAAGLVAAAIDYARRATAVR